MALTPEQVQKYRQQFGITSPTTKPTNTQSDIEARKARLREAMAAAEPEAPVAEKEPGFFSRASSAIKNTVETAADKAYGFVNQGIKGEINPVQAAYRATAEGFTTPFKAAGDVVVEGAKTAYDKLVTDEKKKQYAEDFKRDPGMQGLLAEVGKVAEKTEELGEKYPDAKATLQLLSTFAEAVGVTRGAKVASKVAKEAGDVALDATALAAKGAGELSEAAGRTLKGAGEAATQSALTPTVSEAELLLKHKAAKPFLQRVKEVVTGESTAPQTRAVTAAKHGVAGRMTDVGVKAKRQADKLWKETIAPKVKSVKKKFVVEDLFGDVAARIGETMEPGRKKALLDAFDALQEDYGHLTKITVEDAQKIKSQLDKFTPSKIFKGQEVKEGYNTVKNYLADSIRERTYEALRGANIKGAYRDWANLSELQKVGVKALTDAGRKGGFGGFWTTMWDMATVPIKTVGGQVLYRVGDKLEFVGKKGLKKFSEFLEENGFTRQ